MLLISSFGYSREDGAGSEPAQLWLEGITGPQWKQPVECAAVPTARPCRAKDTELTDCSRLMSILCLCVFVSCLERSKAKVHKLLVRVLKVSIYYCKIFKSIYSEPADKQLHYF